MKKKILNELDKLIYFRIENLLALDHGYNKKNVEMNIYNWLKNGDIISIKRGIYITYNNYLKYYKDEKFVEFLAGIIKYPSYLSLEYILAEYNILTEGVYGITSVTLKTGSIINNKINSFSYRNIKKTLFYGYIKRNFYNYEYYEATKAKALFDYFYYKKRSLSDNLINRNLIEDLRLNLDCFEKNDYLELTRLGALSNSKKMLKIIKNILNNKP